MSTVWKDTNGYDKKYRCASYVYITMLSYSYSIIMDRAMNSYCHENNVVDILNATDKCYLREQMELIGKLSSNYTSNVVNSSHFFKRCSH